MVEQTYKGTMDFTVPGTGGSYASEILYLSLAALDEPHDLQDVFGLVANVVSLPTSAEAELDLLKPGGNPELEADWRKDVVSWTSEGLQSREELSGFHARIRVVSGGSSGTATVDASWEV